MTQIFTDFLALPFLAGNFYNEGSQHLRRTAFPGAARQGRCGAVQVRRTKEYFFAFPS